VRALDCLHVEVHGSGVRVCANGSIARIRKRARLSVAEAGDIVLVAAEVFLFRGSGMR
jgi:hypothetical protein